MNAFRSNLKSHPGCVTLLVAIGSVVAGSRLSHASGGGGAMDPAVVSAEMDIGPASEAGVHGVKLGDFRVRVYYPTEARKSSITFLAFAAVKEEALPKFRELFVHRRNKIRDQVIVATRRVPLADFDDPELHAFRRRILFRLRRMMPELAIDDIYVSEFRLDVDGI
ncbi:MAG: hypothetical protein L0Z07_07500 [Planctomycetes bacterium]|nr:hypothetical protein [Planctomycetota bacterium]